MSKSKQDVADDIVARAKEYAADPSKGYAAGYQPRTRYQTTRGIGERSQQVRVNSDEQAWTEGIAEKDLPRGTWRLLPVIGRKPILDITDTQPE